MSEDALMGYIDRCTAPGGLPHVTEVLAVREKHSNEMVLLKWDMDGEVTTLSRECIP